MTNSVALGIAYTGDSSKWTYGSVTTDVTCKSIYAFPRLNVEKFILYRGFYKLKCAHSISVVIQDTKLITTPTTSGVTLDSDTLFYIRPTTNAVLSVGFTGNGVSTPSDAVTTDFIFYGT